ncbi:NYN domain-containing protein [Dyella sp.]|uniref:NYN domain-containing protein n=1 Tax=Dyella sp. TaxID=1869338 RepID=UPI002849A5B4|nr:NYN domain-containing protein [Dyella sp.]MDR3444468.1 NYN domain-containing protein [Dyella sp.]
MSLYLFIDGAYLSRTIAEFSRKMYDGRDLPFDYQALQAKASVSKVFYYNAPPEPKHGETDEAFRLRDDANTALIERLYDLPNWHISAGVIKTPTNKKAQQTQKEVDVQIAVDMLLHTMRKNATEMSFIAGDRDFRPLVDALIREGMRLRLFYDPSSIDQELKRAADIREPMHISFLHQCLAADFQRTNPMPQLFLSQALPLSPMPKPIFKGQNRRGQIVTIRERSVTHAHIAIRHAESSLSTNEWASFDDVEALKRYSSVMWGVQAWEHVPQ